MYGCRYLTAFNLAVADTACYRLELLTQIYHPEVKSFTIPDVDTFRKLKSSDI